MVRKDIKVDSDFIAEQNENGQFKSVSRQDEFHQAVSIRLAERVRLIERDSGLDDETKERLKLAASRVARNHDYMDDINDISIELDGEKPGTVQYVIDYKFGGTYAEMIQ